MTPALAARTPDGQSIVVGRNEALADSRCVAMTGRLRIARHACFVHVESDVSRPPIQTVADSASAVEGGPRR